MAPKYLWMRPILGILITVGFLGMTGYMGYKVFSVGLEEVSKEILILFVALVQALILMAKDGFGFYFGTSQGSANKSETLDRILNGTAPPTEPEA